MIFPKVFITYSCLWILFLEQTEGIFHPVWWDFRRYNSSQRVNLLWNSIWFPVLMQYSEHIGLVVPNSTCVPNLISQRLYVNHDDVTTWKCSLHCCFFLMGIHGSSVDSHHKWPVMCNFDVFLCSLFEKAVEQAMKLLMISNTMMITSMV